METLAIGFIGWASGIVTVLAVAPYLRQPQQPSGKATIGFKQGGYNIEGK